MPNSIKRWLEDVKPGYGDRFAGAFDEVGVEDISDLRELGEAEAFEELERALQARGAKLVQLQKIRKALMTIATAQRAGPAPTAAGVAATSGLSSHPALKALRSLDAAPGPRIEKPMLKNVFGIGLPVMRPQQRQAAVTPPSPLGYTLMQAGDGPRVYVVHGIDGDHQAAGAAFRRVAALLGNCQVVALEYNEEARTCGTLPALAALYNQRIVGSAHAGSSRSMYIAGYSLGCILAHQMALQMQEAGAQAGLLLFGSEVTWPAEGSSTRRMGGYEWLGGSIEAALFLARSLGGLDFAEAEVASLLQSRAEERDANKVHMKVYWKLCGPKDLPYEDFQHTVSTGARNMDMLRALMWRFEPQRSFEGYTLLVLAPESPEFHTAQEVNARHCLCLKTLCVAGTGNHYNMLEGRQAPIVANAVLSCLREQGENVVMSSLPQAAPPAPVPAAMPVAVVPMPGPVVAAAPVSRTSADIGSIQPSVTQEDVNKQLLSMINSIAIDPIPLDENLMDSGFDSISTSLLVNQMQTDFGVEVPQSVIMDLETPAALARYILENMPAAAPPAQPQLHSVPPAPPVAISPAPPSLQLSPVADLPVVQIDLAPPQGSSTSAAGAAAPSPAAVRAAQAVPVAASGMELLHDGKGPCVYMVHGIDGDIWGIGNSYRAVAPLLAPCRCCALALDDEALACDTLPALAAVYNGRIRTDLKQHPERPVVVMGYSMGCVFAHQMALQFQTSGLKVTLIMVDFEVSWPPMATTKRIGGYDWLGGEFEAPLLIARGMGLESQMWAAGQIEELLAMPKSERNAAVVQAKAFQEITSRKKGFRLKDFNQFVEKGSRNMDRLNAMAKGKFVPTGVFEGDALLVLAPDSPENTEPALEVNGQYCRKMEVQNALGTHYTILTAEKAPAAARAVLGFLKGLGHEVPRSPKIDVKGLACISEGDGPRVYMVHGIDANLHGVGQAYQALAPLLQPCCCLAFAFDQEAQSSNGYQDLVNLYCKRAWQDAKYYPDRPVVIMGYSMGCVIAHTIALTFQEQGVQTSLVMIDFEISWPPEPTSIRIGGYEWLGGELEAALLVTRSMSPNLQQWTGKVVEEYLAKRKEDRDGQAVLSEICTKLVAARRGFTMKMFEEFTGKGGQCMQRLHEVCGKVVPKSVYRGPNLLIVAPESPENFEPATRVNGQYCDQMQVVTAVGTHYDIIQQEKAHVTASRCLTFFRSLGYDIPASAGLPLRGNDSIEVLREGGPNDPLIYLVHDDNAAAEGFGRCWRALAERFGPCHCRAVAVSSQLQTSEAPEVILATAYALWQDATLFNGRQVFVAGLGEGAWLAHAMAVGLPGMRSHFKCQDTPASHLLLVAPKFVEPAEDLGMWLGAPLEAAVQSARWRGEQGRQLAARAAEAFAALPAEQRDSQAAAAKLLEEVGPQVQNPETSNGFLLRWLRHLDSSYKPEDVFPGKTLAVLPTEKSSGAVGEALEKFCSSLEVAAVPGEPGLQMSPELMDATADAMLGFARRCLQATEQVQFSRAPLLS